MDGFPVLKGIVFVMMAKIWFSKIKNYVISDAIAKFLYFDLIFVSIRCLVIDVFTAITGSAASNFST